MPIPGISYSLKWPILRAQGMFPQLGWLSGALKADLGQVDGLKKVQRVEVGVRHDTGNEDG